MQKPQLELSRSKLFIIILLFLYLIAIFCIGFSLVPLLLQMLLIGLCLLSLILTLRRYALLSSPQSIIQAKAVTAQQWKIIQRNGQQHSVQLVGKSICTRWLVILNFTIISQALNDLQNIDVSKTRRFIAKILKAQQTRLSLLVFPDSIDRNRFRQLRAYLHAMRGRLE